MSEASGEKSATSGGRINKSAQERTNWKEIFSISHFKGGDKTAKPKTVSILEDDAGTIYLSARDENNRVMIRLDDNEAAELMVILQARLLKKGMIR
jgi:hypothetical protein